MTAHGRTISLYNFESIPLSWQQLTYWLPTFTTELCQHLLLFTLLTCEWCQWFKRPEINLSSLHQDMNHVCIQLMIRNTVNSWNLRKCMQWPFLILTEDYQAVLLRRWSSPGIKLSWSPVRPLPHELKTVLFITDIWLPRFIDQPCLSQLYCPAIESTDQMRLSKIPNVILECTHDASPQHHHTTEGHQSQPGL